MADDQIVSVKILERTYKVKCDTEQAQELQAAAQYLNDQMDTVRRSGTVTSTDRVAIITALNIAHELLAIKKQKTNYLDTMGDRIQALSEKVKAALAETEETGL